MARVIPAAVSSKNWYRWKRPEPAAAQFRQLVVAQAKLSRVPPVLLGGKVQGGEQVVEKVRRKSPEQLKSLKAGGPVGCGRVQQLQEGWVLQNFISQIPEDTEKAAAPTVPRGSGDGKW